MNAAGPMPPKDLHGFAFILLVPCADPQQETPVFKLLLQVATMVISDELGQD